MQRQLNAFLPNLAFAPSEEALGRAWNETVGTGFILEFGLAHEFMLPLQTGHSVDPFVGLVAALNDLRHGHDFFTHFVRRAVQRDGEAEE